MDAARSPEIQLESPVPFVEAGDRLRFHLLRLASPGAPGLRARFTDFRLPEGVRVYL